MTELNAMPLFRYLPKYNIMKKINSLIYSSKYQQLRKSLGQRGATNFAQVAETVRDEMDLRVTISLRDREKIPAQGRLLIVANHPLAFLDVIALYTAISEIREDVVAVVDSLLEYVPAGAGVILNDPAHGSTGALREIHRALRAEKAVIIFPAKSRHWGLRQITDGTWHKSIVQIAAHQDVPLLPVFIAARNKFSHYFWTALAGIYSELALDCEVSSHLNRNIALQISHPIMPEAIKGIRPNAGTRLLRKHVYQIGRGKPGTFRTTRNVVHPTDKKQILDDVTAAEILGETDDKIKILLVRYLQAPALMREIGRLRELTFRKVGEGTGKKIDLDEFDPLYLHIVLWDPAELEVVGAYRLAPGDTIYHEHGLAGFYTSSLFRFSEEFEKYLPQSLELGRSFVQPRYWNSQALDYLWHGIGAFLAVNPQYNYLFGPVSVSASYTREARELLVWFYQKWFGAADSPVRAKHRFTFQDNADKHLSKLFSSAEYKQSFKELKQNLKHYGYAVPTLYKQYTELCKEGGVQFLDFGIDKDFNNSLDGFIFLEIAKIKDAKLERYVFTKKPQEQWLASRAPYATLQD
jgi:putative hemolysin